MPVKYESLGAAYDQGGKGSMVCIYNEWYLMAFKPLQSWPVNGLSKGKL